MIPILYASNETQFTSNGIGRLVDATYCAVTEERNGEFALEMDLPTTSAFFTEIAEGRFIYAPTKPGGSRQIFEIAKIEVSLSGMASIYASHISYRLNKIITMPFTSSSCISAVSGLKTNAVGTCPFNFWTDKNVSASFNNKIPTPIRSLLGGQEGSILDVFGKGEYEFDNYDVKLYQNRGSDRGVTIRYGKNLTDLVDKSDTTNVYTGIVPYYENELGTVTLPEKVIWGTHASEYPYQMAKSVDFSSRFDTQPTVAQLRAAANEYLSASTGWQINNNLKVSFVSLSDTEEYKDVAVLQRVNLCDTVTIITELGEETTAEVVRVVYDVLGERYTSIELGDSQTSLGQAIQDEILEVVPTTSFMQEAIANGTKLITGGLGGYVVLKPNANGQPEELLVMDNQDYNVAEHIWRFNKNGIGYSANGYQGTFKQAWTIDGKFYTDWVTAGSIKAGLVNTGVLKSLNDAVIFDLDNGTLTLGNKALRITAGNIKLDSSGNLEITGKITATSGYIGGANGFTITSNKLYNGKDTLNGTANGVYIGTNGIAVGAFDGGKADATGFRVSSGGVVTTGGIKFFTGSGTTTATYGLWAKSNNTIGSGGGCDFNSENATDNHLRGHTIVGEGNGSLDVYGGAWISGDLRFDRSHGYNIRDVDEISAYGTIYTSGRMESYYGKFTTCQADNFVPSDRRIKADITDLEHSEEFVEALRPMRFKYTDRDGYHHGFIAQDVQEALKDDCAIVMEDEDGMLSVNYAEIVADLVGVVQKQQSQIKKLETRLKMVESLLEGDGK